MFFFNDTATTEIYTLSLHDALPISPRHAAEPDPVRRQGPLPERQDRADQHRARPEPAPVRPLSLGRDRRSEEHTSELQSRQYLVCRLLLENKQITGGWQREEEICVS